SLVVASHSPDRAARVFGTAGGVVIGGPSNVSTNAPSHLIDLLDLDRGWVREVFAEAEALRARRGAADAPRPLAGVTAALVFHKPSLRTRVSFTVGMHDLGGDAVNLTAVEVSEHGREHVKDVAHVLSGMCGLVVIRTFSHQL